MTIQEALLGFLEEEEEAVVRPQFERVAGALAHFVEHLKAGGAEDVSSVTLTQVEEFLRAAGRAAPSTPGDVPDAWYSVKRFLKWLKRRKYSGVYEEFSRSEGRLREELRKRTDGGARDGAQGAS